VYAALFDPGDGRDVEGADDRSSEGSEREARGSDR
jgi:hypothetical protein